MNVCQRVAGEEYFLQKSLLGAVFFFFPQRQIRITRKGFLNLSFKMAVSYIMTTHSVVVQTGLRCLSSILNRPDAWQ